MQNMHEIPEGPSLGHLSSEAYPPLNCIFTPHVSPPPEAQRAHTLHPLPATIESLAYKQR